MSSSVLDTKSFIFVSNTALENTLWGFTVHILLENVSMSYGVLHTHLIDVFYAYVLASNLWDLTIHMKWGKSSNASGVIYAISCLLLFAALFHVICVVWLKSGMPHTISYSHVCF